MRLAHRAIPFEYTWGGGGVERSPIKKSWGEGVKIKKIIGRGVCQILKNKGRGGGLPGKKHRVWGKSQVRFQDTAITCCSTPLLANGAGVHRNHCTHDTN